MSAAPAFDVVADREPAGILLVDNDPVTARLVTGALEERGIGPVTVVRSLTEAGHAIATEVFASAIVDLHLSDGNGMEFVHLARRGRRSRNPALTIVVCSAYAGDRAAQLLRRLGADDVLAKPPNIDRLVERLTGRRQGQAEN